jgi:hypothetical protein
MYVYTYIRKYTNTHTHTHTHTHAHTHTIYMHITSQIRSPDVTSLPLGGGLAGREVGEWGGEVYTVHNHEVSNLWPPLFFI